MLYSNKMPADVCPNAAIMRCCQSGLKITMHALHKMPSPHSGLRPGWLLRALLVLVFCLQLFVETQHHHDLGTVDKDCVACDLAMQFSGSAPVSEPELPALVLVCFFVVAAVRYHVHLPLRRHLLPFSQAPPALS